MLESIDELVRQIQLGEDSDLELKTVRTTGARVTAPSQNDLADELAAMGNTNGGLLLLGVDDKTRDVFGIPMTHLDAAETLVREACNDSIDPPLLARIRKIELPDQLGEMRLVVRVDVPRSLFVHRSPGGYFQRIGSSKRQMRPDLLARLFQQRSQARLIRFDEQVVPNTTPGTLLPELYERFLGDRTDVAETLRKLKLVAIDDGGDERATVAGVLLATRSPQAHLPGAFIEAVRYRGVRQDSNYQLDAAQITGPLDEQILGALAFCRRNMTVAATKSPARVDVPQFAERAMFEAVVNAVAHRDYSVAGSKIRLFMFDDRLEVYSPGALPNSLSVESLELRQSTRNELVTQLLGRCSAGPASLPGRTHFMEKRGDGAPIIIQETLALAGRRPTWRVLDDAEVLLTLPSATVN